MDSIWNESAMRQYVNRETVENLLLPENVFECNCSFSSEDKVKIESLTDGKLYGFCYFLSTLVLGELIPQL